MKNKLLKLFSVAAIGFSAILSPVSAMNLDDLEDPFNLKSSKEGVIGVSVTQEQLDAVEELNKNNMDVLLGYNSKTIATTYDYDENGNVENVREKEITPEEEALIAKNPNVHILSDVKLHDVSKEILSRTIHNGQHETNSKKVEIYYYTQSGKYVIQMCNTWKTNPNKHSFDIIAARWDNYKSTSDYTLEGYQHTLNGTQQDYTESSSSDHMKKFNYGGGLSQNLFDNIQPLINMLKVRANTNYGTYVYSTYQHATSNVSLAISKSYTISSSGLGGVINHSYSSYYDGMEGVYTGP